MMQCGRCLCQSRATSRAARPRRAARPAPAAGIRSQPSPGLRGTCRRRGWCCSVRGVAGARCVWAHPRGVERECPCVSSSCGTLPVPPFTPPPTQVEPRPWRALGPQPRARMGRPHPQAQQQQRQVRGRRAGAHAAARPGPGADHAHSAPTQAAGSSSSPCQPLMPAPSGSCAGPCSAAPPPLPPCSQASGSRAPPTTCMFLTRAWASGRRSRRLGSPPPRGQRMPQRLWATWW